MLAAEPAVPAGSARGRQLAAQAAEREGAGRATSRWRPSGCRRTATAHWSPMKAQWKTECSSRRRLLWAEQSWCPWALWSTCPGRPCRRSRRTCRPPVSLATARARAGARLAGLALGGCRRALGRGGRPDEKRSGGGGRLFRHGELLQGEVVADLQEGGEGTTSAKMTPDGGVLLVEDAEDVENKSNKSTVSDGLAKIGEVIGHTFEALAVVRDGQSPCTKVRNRASR